jgi:hypothetical protein
MIGRMAYDPAMATVSRPGALNLRLTAGEPRVLKLLQYELDKAGVAAEFAAEPDESGGKGAGDLLQILVVVAATLAEARKILAILVDAKVRLGTEVRATADEIIVTNADLAHVEKIIEGHFKAGPEPPTELPPGSSGG